MFRVAGWPCLISEYMPDIAPGSTPILFGDLQAGYMLIHRKAVTMLRDPYSSGFCINFRWEARVGGDIVGADAMRLLRVL